MRRGDGGGLGPTGNNLGQVAEQPRAEHRQGKRLGASSGDQTVERPALGLPRFDGGEQAGGRGVEIRPADRVVDRLRRASDPQGNHGCLAGEGLDRHDPEVLIRREQQGPATAVVVADDLVALPAEEPDGGTGQTLQPRPLRTSADDDQPASRGRACLDGVLDPLVGDEGRDDQVEVVARGVIGRVERRIDGGLDHAALAAVAAVDPVADRLRDGHEVRDASRSGPVLATEPVKQGAGDGSPDRLMRPGREVGVAAVPGVPHRGKAVADVRHARRWPDHLGHAVTQADDEVDLILTLAQSPGARGQGHDGQELAVVLEHTGNPLERRGADVHAFDRRTESPASMDQGMQGGVGERLAKDFQAFLPPPHPGQPVMHQGYPQARESRSWATDCRCGRLADAGVHAGLQDEFIQRDTLRSSGGYPTWRSRARSGGTWVRRSGRGSWGVGRGIQDRGRPSLVRISTIHDPRPMTHRHPRSLASLHLDQLQVEEQGRVAGNGGLALGSVGEVGGNGQLALLSDLHSGHPLVPAGDDLT